MRRSRGFTLLELVIAIGMTAIVAGVIGAALRAAFQVRDRAQAATEVNRATDSAGEIVTADLAYCLPLGGTLATTFTGAVDDVAFYISGSEPKSDVPGDMRKIEYAVVADPDAGQAGQMLVRRVTTNLLAPVMLDPPDEVVCRNVTLCTFGYYDGLAWNDTWDASGHPNALPMAVQMTLELSPLRGSDTPRRTMRIIPLTCATQPAVTGGG